MINFINCNSKYKPIIQEIIDPIKKHLVEYCETQYCIENAINVHFFNEAAYIQNVKLTGKNVFISHGIADKNWRNINKVNIFDYVFVSGQAWKTKLINQGMDKDKILIGGYPKMDNVFNILYNCTKKNNVIWLPTHDAIASVSSYPILESLILNWTSDFNIINSIHPAKTNDNIKSKHLLLNADVVIADSGSTIYEAWALGKPVVFPDWLVRNGINRYFNNTFEQYIYDNSIGYHSVDESDMKNQIKNALTNGITKSEIDFIENIFPTQLRGNSGLETAKLLLQLEDK